jgi:hypothetical protein
VAFLQETPGEPLVSGAGAAAAPARDLGPADGALAGVDGGALLGVDAAAVTELATRALVWDGKVVTHAFCLIIGWWRRGAGARN